jgi:phosphoribosylformylglycinamidine synthase
MDLKSAGDRLYVVGATYDELAGSEYCAWLGASGRRVPEVRAESARTAMARLSEAIAAGLVTSCHDMSEGGLGVAVAEMAFAGNLGAELDLSAVPLGEEIDRNDIILFSESNSRFVVEVAASHAGEFEARMAGVPCVCVGRVTDGRELQVTGLESETVLLVGVDELKAAWKRPLDW